MTWRKHLSVSFRLLLKNPGYAFLNVAGLAVGLAACLLIFVFIRYESSYDASLPGASRIFQMQTYFASKNSSDRYDLQLAAYATKYPLMSAFPQIESAVFLDSSKPTLLREGQAVAIDNFHFVDGPFFDVFPLPLMAGDSRALANPGDLVLTESEALKRFGTSNILGRTLTLSAHGKRLDYRVTGVLRDLPRNSHLAISMLARADFPALFADSPGFLTMWGWHSGSVYVKLRHATDARTINDQLSGWKKRFMPEDRVNGQSTDQVDGTSFALVNIRQIHLGKAQGGAMTPGIDPAALEAFGLVALLILAMASINFTNLATARASQRAREVALRKVLGASRAQLIAQFLVESTSLAGISMIFALALAEIVLPWFARFLGADLRLAYVGTEGILLPALGLVLVVGVAAGLYPAFYLSRFEPARILKANKSAADSESSGRVRNLLVVVQFGVSIGLMACTAIIYAQSAYARSLDPGFRRGGLLQLKNVDTLGPRADELARQLAAQPSITSVGRTTIGVNTSDDTTTSVIVPGRPDPVSIGKYDVDTGFFQTLGIGTVAGRIFDANRPMDDATTPDPEDPAAEQAMVKRGENVVLNVSGARRLGFASPSAAVGRQVKLPVQQKYGGTMNATVIGVVGDSRFRSVSTPIEPMMFSYHRLAPRWLVARYRGSPQAARTQVAAVWHRLAPDVPFDATFSEDIVAKMYSRIDQRAQLFAAFSILAIIVGALGLFGLAAFSAERRTKEIGIRKVLGARAWDIVRLLVWQFNKPVLVANLIAWPVAWWAMRDWLATFDARIPLTLWPFVLAGAGALLIAVATVAGHAIKVSRLNPIHALRYE